MVYILGNEKHRGDGTTGLLSETPQMIELLCFLPFHRLIHSGSGTGREPITVFPIPPFFFSLFSCLLHVFYFFVYFG